MRNFIPALFVLVLAMSVQPVAAADWRRDVQVLRQSIMSLQSQLRVQSRAQSRVKTLESRLARLEQPGTRPGGGSSVPSLESRLRKLEIAVSKLSIRVTGLQNSGSGSGSGDNSLKSRLQKLENVVKISGDNVTLEATGKVTMTGNSAQIDSGSVKVNTGVATFSGTVKSDTVITDSVVSKAYTPGAGNIW